MLIPGFAGSWDTLNIKLQIAQTMQFSILVVAIIHLPLVAV